MKTTSQDFLKFGSAPSIESMHDLIAEFYCGEQKELREDGNGGYTVHSKLNGRNLSTCVLRKGSRYIFGTYKH